VDVCAESGGGDCPKAADAAQAHAKAASAALTGYPW